MLQSDLENDHQMLQKANAVFLSHWKWCRNGNGEAIGLATVYSLLYFSASLFAVSFLLPEVSFLFDSSNSLFLSVLTHKSTLLFRLLFSHCSSPYLKLDPGSCIP